MQETDIGLVTEAIRAAGRIAAGYARAGAKSWDKPGGAGPVTEADIAVNSYLSDALRGARPGYGWLSEESEDSDERLSQDTVFIVDPIDGTRSFVDGSKTWAHSIAVSHKGTVVVGAVYLPLRDLLYTAVRGSGAWLNGEPLKVSDRESLPGANVLAARPVEAPEHWKDGQPGFRRSHRPSLAYRLGLVGQGRFDAMLTLRPTWEWDVAAGALIVEEASGICTDRSGKALRFNSPSARVEGLIAAGKWLHPSLLEALRH